MEFGVVNSSAHLKIAYLSAERGEHSDKSKDDYKTPGINGEKN